MKRLELMVVFILLLICPAGDSQAQISGVLKKIPKRIPGLDKIIQREPAITTTFQDAVYGVPFLDDFNPRNFESLDSAERTAEGCYILNPGLYRFEVPSYCLKAATFAPQKKGGEEGYLYAPIKGPRADIVTKIIRRSLDHPEIPQREIQLLLWAIISHTKISDMSRERQSTAAKLLTRKEIAEMNDGALRLIPENLLDIAFNKMPPEAAQVLKAESRLRNRLTRAHSTYEEIERIAVLRGNPPDREEKGPPLRRWSLRPEGVFIRYSPEDYKKVTVEIYVPEYFQLEFDEQGRITLIADDKGNRIETAYDDTVGPMGIDGESSLKGMAFQSIRFERSDASNPDGKIQAEWIRSGWTFVGVPAGKGSVETPTSDRFAGLDKRYVWANEHREQLKRLDEHFKPQGSMDLIMNLGHLWYALDSVLTAEDIRGKEWAVEHLCLVKRAWQFSLWLREMYSDAVDESGYEPVGNDAVHRDNWVQRLALTLFFKKMNWHNFLDLRGYLQQVKDEADDEAKKIRRRERRKPMVITGVVR